MSVLGIDTATPATAVAVLAGERTYERREDPAPGERPAHARTLLALVEQALADAGGGWEGIERIAVGLGPGSFTGIRVGIAIARALALARELPLAGVSTLAALAAAARADPEHGRELVLATIAAPRGEAFLALWRGAELLRAPGSLAADALVAAVAQLAEPCLAVGEGAVRLRERLEVLGATIPGDGSPLHRISPAWTCRLGAAGRAGDPADALPEYLREPDARPRTP